MRHPFAGVTPVQGKQHKDQDSIPELNRRSVLGRMLFGTGATLVAVSAARAELKLEVTTEAVGEEGGRGVPTTLALGEEGGLTKARGEDGGQAGAPATTEPFGEEAGKVTSYAVPGLEDGGAPPAPKPTEAKKEEGIDAPVPPPVTGALGEGGAITQAFPEGGGPLTRALNEGGIPARAVVQVKPLEKDLNEKQLDPLWTDLSSKDAYKALQASAIIYGSKQGITYLKSHLKLKVPELDEKEVAKLITGLDADDFASREKAEMELAKLGPIVLPSLEKALASAGSAEVRMRLQRLVEKFKDANEFTQAQRGLEVLVALKESKDARELLQTLSKGEDKDWMTQQAKKALERAGK